MSSEVALLVAAAERGDEAAWNALVDRFSGLMWHVIRGFRLPRAAGEDIFQVTWLRATEHIGRIRNPDAFGGWLATTARNECLRAVRRQQRERLQADPEVIVDTKAALDQGMLDEARNEQLWAAFEQLPAKCQHLLRLMLTEPAISYDEVSEVLNIPVGSIGPTRSRCLKRLRSTSDIRKIASGG